MPDFFDNRTKQGVPGGWSEAFAALPVEMPPVDGWARLTCALDGPASRRGAMRRERRMSWMIGLASAAMLVAVTWAPLSQWLEGSSKATPPIATEAPGLRGPAAPLRNETASPKPAIEHPIEDIRVASSRNSDAPKSPDREPTRSARAFATQSRGEAAPVLPPTSTTSTTVRADATGFATAAADVELLHRLKTQSAQLEALVALARDERVANASSELLSSDLDSGIAAVDAALSQLELSDARKRELWQQRVDLLQQLAGVEATSRWLAAQGTSNETALVSVY